MKARQTDRTLRVLQNGAHIGMLGKETNGGIYFQYEESWLANGDAFPVSLSLPLRDDRYLGNAVVAVFENLLPDNDSVRRRIAARTGASGRDAYSLLEVLGRDCVGALQFLTEDDNSEDSGKVAGLPMTEKQIAGLLRDLHISPLGISTGRDFRISLAGAQEKTALLYWKNQWHIPKGTTPTTHILKPQIGKLHNGLDLSESVENEHFCMELLANLGLPVAKTEILDFEDVRTLSIRRFDRSWKDKKTLLRQPQEDLLQALGFPSGRKYEADGGPGISAIIKFLSGSDRALNDQILFLKAQICYWLMGATDGHAKNFSIHLGAGERYIMTPLYDIMSSEPYYIKKQIPKNQMKMAMAVGKNRRYRMDVIGTHHFEETARMSGLSTETVHRIIGDIGTSWEGARDTTFERIGNQIPGHIKGSIVDGFSRRLKLIS